MTNQTNNKKTVAEEIRKIADLIWNKSGNYTHNKLDEILGNAFKETFHEIVSSLESQKKCEFESDGEKHSCVSGCDGIVENCRKCHRDKCSNIVCPLGKGLDANITWNAAINQSIKIIRERCACSSCESHLKI